MSEILFKVNIKNTRATSIMFWTNLTCSVFSGIAIVAFEQVKASWDAFYQREYK